MTSYSLSPIWGAGAQLFDNNGVPLSGGKIYVYAAGTTTPATVYTDSLGNVPHTNPIITNASGRIASEIWFPVSGSFKFVLKDANDVLIATYDNIPSIPQPAVTNAAASISYNTGYTVTAGAFTVGATYQITTLGSTDFISIGASANVVGIVFTASGIGSGTGTANYVRSVQSKLRESISVKDFGAVGDGITDDTVALQAAINALNVNANKLVFPLGTYVISDRILAQTKTDFEIDGQMAVIIAQNGMAVVSGKELLSFRNCNDFSIKNLIVDGNRSNRVPAEVPAHSIEFRSCHRFLAENVWSNNAVVDGYVFNTSTNTNSATFCTDFTMINCYADNCYRQGMSIINAYNFKIIGGAFTNTNGTGPAAGVDVESDVGAVTPSNRNGSFEGCQFTGNAGLGLLLSGVGGACGITVKDCYFSSNVLGGTQVNTDDTHLYNCIFENHSAAAQGVVFFSANTDINSGSVVGCRFANNTNTTYCVYIRPEVSGVLVSNNQIANHANGSGFFIAGTGHTVSNNQIVSCGNIAILMDGSYNVVSDNYIHSATSRGIYNDTGPNLIVGNVIKDVASVAGGYIQTVVSGTTIRNNVLLSSVAAATTYGVYSSNSAVGNIIAENTFINLHTTQPIGFSGSVISQHAVYSNIGGTDNDARKMQSGMAFPAYTTAARPAATTVPDGYTIRNSTTNKLNTSNGTAWYNADGTAA